MLMVEVLIMGVATSVKELSMIKAFNYCRSAGGKWCHSYSAINSR